MTKTTLQQVAKHASVSPSTVSRFLNQTTFVSEEKSNAIQEAIQLLKFEIKNPIKKKDKQQRTMTIGVLVQNPESPYTSRILEDMELELSREGYNLVIVSGHWQNNLEISALNYLKNTYVDGIIIIMGSLTNQQILAFTQHCPVVAIGYNIEGDNLYSISVDNNLGGYIATLHLIQLGHEHIVHLKGVESQPDAISRFEGYKQSLTDSGITFNPRLVRNGEFSSEGGYRAIQTLLKSNVKFSAIFAANDQMAYGAMKALYDAKIKVPEQISIIGFDDLPSSRFFTPALSTLRQPVEEIGVMCASSMLQLLKGQVVRAKLPPIELITRQTTIQFKSDDKRSPNH
ncbi:substrate-binding domain-containing protein [Vibrio sp. SS-MA-C1-2]|uniref:substrate-binding domain-containing protein n=1 Tax=Vibrio sp. SS-MA-C1-2 TaxID=2908646 RepID=UPI001F339C07|nr:substrate-binding domain-containing protein [Vibrio sp. SS-MA-C1-2]UJF18403.1 substrate-binding domain-containing protein [Vibrio sp. SS-MA-C1-2]